MAYGDPKQKNERIIVQLGDARCDKTVGDDRRGYDIPYRIECFTRSKPPVILLHNIDVLSSKHITSIVVFFTF